MSDRRTSAGLLDWIGSFFEYSLGTIAYAGVALTSWAVAVRPSWKVSYDLLWPSGEERRLAALIFWLPLLVPIAVAAFTRTILLSLWNTPALTLLPVILLSSPLVRFGREAAVRIAALAVVFVVAACAVSPIVAYVSLVNGIENEAAYAHLVMDAMQRQWRQVTDKPLKLIAGPFGLISTAAFYGEDKPFTFADFSRYLSPWATPERIAREGIAIACPVDMIPCIQLADQLPGGTGSRAEVELRRHWLGFEGPPARFVIMVLPPAGR